MKLHNKMHRSCRVTPGNQEYGEWIVANGLDRGPAIHQSVRSDAIWLSLNWTVISQSYHGEQNNPTAIRKECRRAGHAWAGKTEHEKQRRADSRRAEAKRRYSWVAVRGAVA